MYFYLSAYIPFEEKIALGSIPSAALIFEKLC